MDTSKLRCEVVDCAYVDIAAGGEMVAKVKAEIGELKAKVYKVIQSSFTFYWAT